MCATNGNLLVRQKEYNARVYVKSKLHYFPLLKDRLGLYRCVLFSETCFGRWLDLTYVENEESLIHYTLQKQKISNNDHYDLPLIYSVNSYTLHFGRREFCLISGFNLSDPDSIRVCLLLSLEVVFMGHELGSAVDDVFLRMVEDLDVWNDFPWGEHMWRELYGAIRNVNLNHQEKDRDADSGCQTSTKEVSLKDRVKAMKGLCTSLKILLEEIKSLKARMVNFSDLGDKYYSNKDGEFFSFNVSRHQSANKDPINELVDALDDLVDENGVVEVEKIFLRRFWDALTRLDDKRLWWLLDDFHIQSGNVTFYDSQNIEGVEYRPWYLKMRSCLETKLHVLLHRTGVFASKGIDPNSYSIKFNQEQNAPQQGGLFGDCGVFVCLFLYRLAHRIPLAVEDPIQMALAYQEKMVKFYFDQKIICPS
nr:phospholipase-like, aminotransferase-like mobile domain protein [Tanacetum cinerariifolium]